VPLVATKDASIAYAAMVNGFVALESVCFVGMLVAIYLPSALLIERARNAVGRAQTGTANAGPPAAAGAGAATQGLAFADLMRIAALLAPILAGPVASFRHAGSLRDSLRRHARRL
jgi:hypothetical protein